MDFIFITYLKMQTEIKEIEISGNDHRSDQGYLASRLKEIETMEVDQRYSLNIHNFEDEYSFELINDSIEIIHRANLFV